MHFGNIGLPALRSKDWQVAFTDGRNARNWRPRWDGAIDRWRAGMMNDEFNESAQEATVSPDKDSREPESGGEAWCNDELALDGPGEGGAEDETPIAED